MSITEEIKSRLDIVSYIQQHVSLKKAGRYHKACCPFHAENTPSFVVNEDTQTWRCFGACAEGGDLFNFAMKYHRWSFAEAIQELGKLAGIQMTKESPEEKDRAERISRLRGIVQTAAEIYHQLLMSGREAAAEVLVYARQKRGLVDDTLARFAIGYAPDSWSFLLDQLRHLGYSEEDVIDAGLAVRSDKGRVYDRFRHRFMIPIRDERGRAIGFGARALRPEDNPKYLNSPQSVLFDKSKTLFGLDLARKTIREQDQVVIVEGYLDVIQAHQAGYLNVVAQMGTALTEAQLRLLVPRYTSKVILALDADPAGQNATRRSLETAQATLSADYAGRISADIRILQIPGAKDPDDFLREAPAEWPGLIGRALPVADFLIQLETAEVTPASSLQEREAVARRVLPLLSASENDLLRRDNIQKLARKLHIAERDLLAWAQRQAPAVHAPRPAPDPQPAGELTPPEDAPAAQLPLAVGRAEELNRFEGYCLSILIRDARVYYEINRKFREMAGDDAGLLSGPLIGLSQDDFVMTDYRMLMQVFMQAVAQDEHDVQDFLYEHLDERLHDSLRRLLQQEEDWIRWQLNERFGADQQVVLKERERRVRRLDQVRLEAVEKALSLRRDRLRHELDEVSFIQLDAQEANDLQRALAYSQQIMLKKRAMQRLDAAVQQIRGMM